MQQAKEKVKDRDGNKLPHGLYTMTIHWISIVLFRGKDLQGPTARRGLFVPLWMAVTVGERQTDITARSVHASRDEICVQLLDLNETIATFEESKGLRRSTWLVGRCHWWW